MDVLKLIRFTEKPLKSDANVGPTLGVLLYKEKPLVLTLEPPWKDNKPNISCIPEGTYVCKHRVSNKAKGLTYEVTKVPGRGNILFHPGNTQQDTQGCILVGLQVGDWLAGHSVAMSIKGFEKFMEVLGPMQAFALDISWLKTGTERNGPNAIHF